MDAAMTEELITIHLDRIRTDAHHLSAVGEMRGCWMLTMADKHHRVVIEPVADTDTPQLEWRQEWCPVGDEEASTAPPYPDTAFRRELNDEEDLAAALEEILEWLAGQQPQLQIVADLATDLAYAGIWVEGVTTDDDDDDADAALVLSGEQFRAYEEQWLAAANHAAARRGFTADITVARHPSRAWTNTAAESDGPSWETIVWQEAHDATRNLLAAHRQA